jgi:hypothetical protein
VIVKVILAQFLSEHFSILQSAIILLTLHLPVPPSLAYETRLIGQQDITYFLH